MYDQRELFDSQRPNGSLTGLDLFMNVVREIDVQHADSDAFDPQLLNQVARFKRFFKSSPYSGFQITGSVPDANYADKLAVRFTYSTNGQRSYGIDM